MRALLLCALALAPGLALADGLADPVQPLEAKKVDAEICQVLRGPTNAYGESHRLMQNLQTYYEYLDNANDRSDRGWREERNVRIMLDSVGKEGPRMVHEKVNATAFKKAYEWDDDDVDTMTTTILGIKHMWEMVTGKTSYLST